MHVHGCLYEPGVVNFRKRLMLRLLRRVMRVEPDAFESPIFQSRIAGFVASPEKGRRLTVHVGETSHPLRKRSKRNGQFRSVVRLSHDEVLRAAETHRDSDSVGDGLWLPIQLQVHGGATIEGRVQLLHREGWSVISDIDDTIKHTDVTRRRNMLANTFLNAFQPIAGMADRYRHWQDQGAAFHYVSSSPWQLFEPLRDHCREAGFPDGSIHLRSFRLRDHMLRRLLLLRRSGKAVTIRQIIQAFPWRDFVLVGDSGEKDPEIYGRLAQQYPQVRKVLIRSLPERPLLGARLEKVFGGLPEDRWTIYQDADQLPALIDSFADAGKTF